MTSWRGGGVDCGSGLVTRSKEAKNKKYLPAGKLNSDKNSKFMLLPLYIIPICFFAIHRSVRRPSSIRCSRILWSPQWHVHQAERQPPTNRQSPLCHTISLLPSVRLHLETTWVYYIYSDWLYLLLLLVVLFLYSCSRCHFNYTAVDNEMANPDRLGFVSV